MNNMTDILEQYINKLFQEATENHIVIKRSNVAQKFDCVPSQLNYVIKTRFTPEHGFIIESKRGGGGFIRITKIILHKDKDYIDYLINNINENEFEVSDALKIIKILKDREYITNREFNNMISSVDSLWNLQNDIVENLNYETENNNLEKILNENIRNLTIKFLNNIKYSKRG